MDWNNDPTNPDNLPSKPIPLDPDTTAEVKIAGASFALGRVHKNHPRAADELWQSIATLPNGDTFPRADFLGESEIGIPTPILLRQDLERLRDSVLGTIDASFFPDALPVREWAARHMEELGAAIDSLPQR